MKDIKFLRITSLKGPSMWTYPPVLEAWVDIGELEDFPSNTLPGFNDRLKAWLPSLIEHRCSIGERGGFLQRLDTGTWPGHILEHVTLELQILAGSPGGFGRARETSIRGVYKVVVASWHDEVTRQALYDARELVLAAIEDRPFDVEAVVAKLRKMANSFCLGPSTASIVEAAEQRGIPAIRLNSGNLVQLGYGKAQRRIWTAESDHTSAIAEGISKDKDMTKSLLAACGVPVPEGELVESASQAWESAESLGLPVVVKPSDGNHGRGVFLDLRTQTEVEAAYEVAKDEGSGVIVERYIPGDEHRVLVVGNQVVAVAKGEAAWVLGDGKQTVKALIDTQLNADPRRGWAEECPLNPISVDSSALIELKRQGLRGDSIPECGRKVLVQRNGNHAIDVTDRIHPSVAATCALAARIVGLDIAGIDLVCEDISRPLDVQRGAIVEVNAGPGLLAHIKPAEGQPRPVGQAIADHLFPKGASGRIPLVGVAGTSGTTVTARLVARLLRLSGLSVGLACQDGLYADRRQIERGDRANWAAGRRVLMNRSTEAAVIENTPEVMVGQGLSYDRCTVGVVTHLDERAVMPEYHIDDSDRLFNVLRTQVDVVLKDGFSVLNASDERVADMARFSDGEVVWFTRDAHSPIVATHRAQGGRAVFVRDGYVVLAEGGDERALADLAAIPVTLQGRLTDQVDSVLAAIAAAWALGLSPDLIRAGTETFDVGLSNVPGHFTRFSNPLNLPKVELTTEAVYDAETPYGHEMRVHSLGDRCDDDVETTLLATPAWMFREEARR